jgi:malate dehydrogenase (quinone)/L-2-hydroxyglutarate oxidase
MGPTAVLALSRDGYRRGAVSRADVRDMAGDADLARLLLRHWRAGLGELARDRSTLLLARSLRRLIPELRASDLVPGPCGIRAQAMGPRGSLLDDFVTWQRGPILCVRNAPSPGATASLAIARLIADQLEA